MTGQRRQDIESLEDLEQRRSDELVREEQGDAALERLIDQVGEPASQGAVRVPGERTKDEFVCRACHLIFSSSCLLDDARSLCRDCAAHATVTEPPADGLPQVRLVHHPCPACGAPVTVPDRGEVSCGFICPSCRAHLSLRGDKVHLFYDHHEAGAGRFET